MPRSEPWLHYGERRSLCLRPGSELPPALQVEAEALFEADKGRRLTETRLLQLKSFLAAAQRRKHPIHLTEDARAFPKQRQDEEARRTHLLRSFPTGARDPGRGQLQKSPLLPQQAEGLWFIVNAGRALLADLAAQDSDRSLKLRLQRYLRPTLLAIDADSFCLKEANERSAARKLDKAPSRRAARRP